MVSDREDRETTGLRTWFAHETIQTSNMERDAPGRDA